MKHINKKTTIIILIIFLGCFIRFFGISKYPNALNCDEASSGYEAYSIAYYGVDRNNNSFPVFLQSWGSGQNALLSYLAIPFIKIFGLSVFSIRVPMAILGCLSIIVFYLLLKRITNEKIAFIGLLFFSICPWHIMKSRWGLEANLLPDLILFFVYFFIRGLQDKNKLFLYLSFVIAGLSSYSYGTSYLFLPLFIIPVLLVMKIKKIMSLKEIIVSLLIVAIISLPIILYIFINTFNLEEIHLFCFTIPRLTTNRYQTITTIFQKNAFVITLVNAKELLKILCFQSDELPWNYINNIGTIYLFSTVFTILGILTPLLNKLLVNNSKKLNSSEKDDYTWVFIIWLISSLITSLVTIPTINRINILMIPIIYYTVMGIYYFIDNKKIFGISLIITYSIYFFLFINSYLKEDWNSYSTFEAHLDEVFDYVSNIEDDYSTIMVSSYIKEPYIYTLFYTKFDTNDFINSVEYSKDTLNMEFRTVNSFGKYHFDDVYENIDLKDTIFILQKKQLHNWESNFDISQFNVKEFPYYYVLIPKNPQLDY